MTAVSTPVPPCRRQPGTAAAEAVPGWHVWRTRSGWWWATRTGKLADYQRDGIPMTVNAGSEHELLAELAAHA